MTVVESFTSAMDLKPTADVYTEHDFLNCMFLFTLVRLFALSQASNLYGLGI